MTPALKRMTADEFLDWSLHQEERYELVDGRAVLMAGARQKHDRVVINLIVALGNRLRGGPCRPSTADIGSTMTNGNVRRPDVTIDCGKPDPESPESTEPVVFFEVLSPSTRRTDLIRKANEYRALPSLRHFVLLEPDQTHVHVYTRLANGDWAEPVELESLQEDIALTAVSVRLPMAEIYEDVPLDAGS